MLNGSDVVSGLHRDLRTDCDVSNDSQCFDPVRLNDVPVSNDVFIAIVLTSDSHYDQFLGDCTMRCCV